MFEKHPENSYKCTNTVVWNVGKPFSILFSLYQPQMLKVSVSKCPKCDKQV